MTNVDNGYVVSSYGTYVGNGAVARGIPHNLGRIPHVVMIRDETFRSYRIIRGTAAIQFINSANHAVTAPNQTNFYVGNAASYPESANDGTVNYYWAAF